MSGRGRKKTILKKGKGRAFLRFVIGMLFLFIVLSGGYIFLTRDVVSPDQPDPTPSVEPITDVTTEPTPELETPAVEPVVTPTPVAPTHSTVAADEFVAALEEFGEIPAPGDAVKIGVTQFSTISTPDQSAVSMCGYAFIKGADAAQSTTFFVIFRQDNGEVRAVYQAMPTTNDNGLQFSAEEGSNLESAFFTATVDVMDFEDGQYLLGLMIVNGEQREYAVVDSQYSFLMFEGEVGVYAG